MNAEIDINVFCPWCGFVMERHDSYISCNNIICVHFGKRFEKPKITLREIAEGEPIKKVVKDGMEITGIFVPTKPVRASEMKRDIWVFFEWEDVRTIANREPVYICTGVRDIAEAKEAAGQFDAWSAAGWIAKGKAEGQ